MRAIITAMLAGAIAVLPVVSAYSETVESDEEAREPEAPARAKVGFPKDEG